MCAIRLSGLYFCENMDSTPTCYKHTDTNFRAPPRTHSARTHLMNELIYFFHGAESLLKSQPFLN